MPKPKSLLKDISAGKGKSKKKGRQQAVRHPNRYISILSRVLVTDQTHIDAGPCDSRRIPSRYGPLDVLGSGRKSLTIRPPNSRCRAGGRGREMAGRRCPKGNAVLHARH